MGNGILVDARMQTSHPDIFAAGDVVNFYNPALDQRLRTEHEENANETGMVAGQNMAGGKVEYTLLPRVYSTLFDLDYDAVGLLDPTLETKVDWQEEYKKGVVYYLLDQRVRGVLFWNFPGRIEQARTLIASGEPLNKENCSIGIGALSRGLGAEQCSPGCSGPKGPRAPILPERLIP